MAELATFPNISTVVRASDSALTRIDASGSRVTIGAGTTFSRILAERDLAFLHAPARSIGGPAVRNMGTVGGNLFAPVPYGDFTVALLALDAVVFIQGGLGSRDVPIEEFLQSRERQAGTLVLSISCQKPGNTEATAPFEASEKVPLSLLSPKNHLTPNLRSSSNDTSAITASRST